MGPARGIKRSYELGAPVSVLKKARNMSQASSTSESQSDNDDRIPQPATNGNFDTARSMQQMKQMIEALQLEMKFQQSQIKKLLELLSKDSDTSSDETSSAEEADEAMDEGEDEEEEEKDDGNMTGGGRRALMRRFARRRAAYN